jgi:hypothetical protein
MTPNQSKFELNLLKWNSFIDKAHGIGLMNLSSTDKEKMKQVGMEVFNYILLHKMDDPIYVLKKNSISECIKELEQLIR